MGVASAWGRGHRLLFVVNEAYFFYSHRLPVARAARAAGFEVHVAAPAEHVWAPDRFDVTALADEGFTFHPIPLNRRGRNPLQDLCTMVALWRLFRRVRPSLLHLLTIKPVLYGGIIARLLAVPGVVAAVPGLGHLFSDTDLRSRALRAMLIWLYRASMRNPRCQVIVQNEEDGARMLAAKATRQHQLHVIRGSGVDLAEFADSPEVDAVPLVVLPARLIWAKGIGEYVAAARLLRAQGVSARFALLGDAKDDYLGAVPARQLLAWQDEGVVEWHGRREDMPQVFRDCHVVCLPTTYGEGVPRVLIEAAASGRAAVTTDVPGCRDIIRDGVNGLLVPPGDAEALATALKRLLIDQALRRALASRGRAIAEREFAVEQVVDRTLALYRGWLSAGPAARAKVEAAPGPR